MTAPRRFAPALLLAAALLSFWYADRNLPFQDEGSTLTAAARILRGDVFYRDIDAYPFPGAAYLAAGAMAVAGEHLSVARGLAGTFFCIWVMALYLVAVRLVGAPRAALFGASLLGFKLLAWPGFTAYMYSDLSFTLGCAAVALLMAGGRAPGTARLIGAGLCVAGAVAAKQNLGLYLGAATVLVLLPVRTPWRLPGVRTARSLVVFAGSAAAPLLLAAAWFAAQGVLGQLVFSGLLRPFTGYLPTSGIAFTPMLAWWQLGSLRDAAASSYFAVDYFQLLMVGAMPGRAAYDVYWMAGEIFTRAVYTAVVVAAVWWASRVVGGWRALSRSALAQGGAGEPHRVDGTVAPPGEAHARLLAFGLLALAMLASAFPRADFFHIVSVAAPTALLLAGLGSRPARPMCWPLLALACVVAFLTASGTVAAMQRSLLTHRVQLDRAAVWVAPDNAWMERLVEAIDDELPPGAPFFVYGHEAQLYFLTGRAFSWPFTQLYPGQVGPDGGAEIVALLAQDPPPTIVRGRQFWPGMPRASEYAPRLDRWIRRHYVRDPDVFLRHPLPRGANEPLPQWMSLLRWSGPRTQTDPGATDGGSAR